MSWLDSLTGQRRSGQKRVKVYENSFGEGFFSKSKAIKFTPPKYRKTIHSKFIDL